MKRAGWNAEVKAKFPEIFLPAQNLSHDLRKRPPTVWSTQR
jgi:hypothetical protein